MPTRNVNLTDHFDRFIDEGVASGRFSNASEMVREGLRLLEKRDERHRARIEWYRAEVQKGIDAIERGEVHRFESADDMQAFLRERAEKAIRNRRSPKRSA